MANAIGLQSIPILPVVVKLLLAVFCGSVLGLERTRKRRAAGMRTYSMVCVGAAVVMMTGQHLSGGLWDPARMGAQVVSGIGFIGAGAIIMTGYHEVKGLTTAAGLWASACMGLAIGSGYYAVALLSCAVLFCVVYFGDKLQYAMVSRLRRARFFAMLESTDAMTAFLILAKEKQMLVTGIEQVGGMGSSKRAGVIFELKLPGDMTHQQAFELLGSCPGVLFLEDII